MQARELPVGARLRNRIEAYAVIGLRPHGVPLVMPGGRLLSPFVGRERELAVLDEWLVQAMHGRGQVVGLVGEPGVGKSRLVAEFKASTCDAYPSCAAAGDGAGGALCCLRQCNPLSAGT